MEYLKNYKSIRLHKLHCKKKFSTKKQREANDKSRGAYSTSKKLRFKKSIQIYEIITTLALLLKEQLVVMEQKTLINITET